MQDHRKRGRQRSKSGKKEKQKKLEEDRRVLGTSEIMRGT